MLIVKVFVECLLHCLENIRYAFLLCHNQGLHKLKNCGIAYLKNSSFCFMDSISMPYLLIYQVPLLTLRPVNFDLQKCPVCADLLLVGRRSERLCRRLVTPPTRRVWRSFKFAPFLFFFPVSKVGLPLMGDTAVQ